MTKRKAIKLCEAAVLKAATEYIAEVENPAPDLLYRRVLRDTLAVRVRELEHWKRRH